MPDPAIASSSDYFKLAADPGRLATLAALRGGELDLAGICSRAAQTVRAVSRHLALLRVSGVVESRRDGRRSCYSLAERGRLLLAAHDAMAAAGDPRSRRKGDAA